ncbi:MAG: hypothetical protein M3014_04105 [Chloroflexota bacterium]|nr:hypothetical protein [Chloroflexota bacterium]
MSTEPALNKPVTLGDTRATLMTIYTRLLTFYGPQSWWPSVSGSRWEIMLGAVLTQRTTWRNVELALANLVAAWGEAALTDPACIVEADDDELISLLRPVGHYTTKPRKLRNLARFVISRGGVDRFAASDESDMAVRNALLDIWGVGPETADAILLYALDRPFFVADAYALRLGVRWGLLTPYASYATIQALFMDNLPHDLQLFNEYHALIVQHGKETCRPRPRCSACLLAEEYVLDRPGQTWCCPRAYTGVEEI